jgi:hypothetical protein
MVNTVQRTKRRVFNLLKPYQPPPSGWERVYSWVVGKAKVIMVIVEILVVITFIGKVLVDYQAKNLDDRIKAQELILQRAAPVEPILRKLQSKANAYSLIWSKSSSYSALLNEVNSYIPTMSTKLAVDFSGENITISGQADYNTLAEIERRMKQSPRFANAVITQLSTSGTNDTGNGDYVLSAKIVKVASRTQTQ